MMKNKSPLIVHLKDVDRTQVALVGGKCANLGELLQMEGIHVPPGFCITTEVYRKITGDCEEFKSLLSQLMLLTSHDKKAIKEITSRMRTVIEEIPIPLDIAEEITRNLNQPGEEFAYAVRSSATFEDLPTASFAGQQDSYLNITGSKQVLKYVSKCWASLFTERAVYYRLQNEFDHAKVYSSVIIQQMLSPDVAGIMFTADPITSNRKILSIDASFGLGEALVSGLVNADNFKVCNGTITDKTISDKNLAIYPVHGGGTKQGRIEAERRFRQSLTDEQVLDLESIGRKIENHFGSPQDIEWCLVGDKFYVVQSRPITTLFPIPKASDNENHVYLSVGHQQMMTDAMKPLGLSFWLLTTPAHMRTAGGRLFADVTQMLASPDTRYTIVETLGRFDPLMKDALTTIIERGNFIPSLPGDDNRLSTVNASKSPSLPNYEALNQYDPMIVRELVDKSEASIEVLKKTIGTKSGPALFDFILEDIREFKTALSDPKSFGVIMTGMNAAVWLNEKMMEWLSEKNAADVLSQSSPGNVTSEMGLALLHVADVIRPYPDVINYLRSTKDDNLLKKLLIFQGGRESRDAIEGYLAKYGMRCSGEIDITKPRWIEKPITLVPMILNNIKNFPPNSGKQKFEQGLQQALQKEQELILRLKALPGGDQKASETKRMIELVRNYSGYREYPKYTIVSRYLVYKQALLKEAEKLVQANILHDKEDVFYLSFEEMCEAVKANEVNYKVINERKDDYKLHEKLTPPRVMTSDGELVTGAYKRENLPRGAIAGLAVSSGIIEGRARVILNLEDADLDERDILVTPFTDPSWTPLFVSAKGLVTEVGGLMTHGAVIAREYGLPAVVGVDRATTLIKDGQMIRVNGTDGYVEIL